jgi:putative membrane protein
MGAADIVPGVSGGTIALVLRIYERLVESIRDGSSALAALIRFDGTAAKGWFGKVDWKLLLPLLLGILLAIATLAPLIETLLADHPVELAGAFMGLVAGSTVVAWQLMRNHDAGRVAVLVVVAVATFFLLGLKEGTSEDTVSQLAEPALWAFFGAGAIAICAMILPGISGSFLLVVMGMYGPLLAAVNERDLIVLIVFAVGAILGLAVFSQLLSWALRHHHDTVIAGLIGLMVGSVRVLWPWPGGVDSTALGSPDGSEVAVVVLALAGFALVMLIDLASRRLVPAPEPVIP